MLSDEEDLEEANSTPDHIKQFGKNIHAKMEIIKSKLVEGKSLTKVNKQAILDIIQEVNISTKNFCNTPLKAPTSSVTPITLDRATVLVIKDTIKEEVSKLKTALSPQTATATYSSTLKTKSTHQQNKPEIPITKPAIIVSAKKDVGNSAETLTMWKKEISFKKTNFAPSNVKYVSNNKICVEFDNQEQCNTVLQMANHPESNISAEISKKLKPMIILKGVSTEIPTSELAEIIKNQNDLCNDFPNFKNEFVFKFKRRNKNENLYNAVFITTPTHWKRIIKQGKLNIDHQRIHCENYVPLLQCFKCLQFGHTKNRCEQDKTVCSHCSSLTHDYKSCPVKSNNDKTRCYNCVIFHQKLGIETINPNHSATSIHCPRIKFMTNKILARTDYG